MAGKSKPEAGQLYRVREGFAVPGPDGFPRPYPTGALIDGGDPLVGTHGHLLEPAAKAVEQATAEPGERRVLGLRLPQRATVEQATEHRTGHAHESDTGVRMPTNVSTDPEGGPDVVHALPPEHPDSPASPHAPLQPGLGVVADDADERGQNQAGGPKSSEAGKAVKRAAAKKVTAAGEGTGERGSAVPQGGDGSTDTVEPDKQGGRDS